MRHGPAVVQSPVGSAAARGGVGISGRLRAAEQARRAGRVAEAERLCKEVLRVEPRNISALKLMGAMASAARLHNTALRYLAAARDAGHDDPEVLSMLGGVLFELGRPEAAAAALRESLRVDGSREQTLEDYAVVLNGLGRAAEAAEVFAALLGGNPSQPRVWQRYSQVRHFPRGAPEVDRIRRLLRQRGLGARERAQLQFALGKMLEDAGDPESAFRAFEAGNRLRAGVDRSRGVPARQQLHAHARRMTDVFTPDFIDALSGHCARRRGLTLIVGTPRSGKSLLEGPLEAHRSLVSYGELDTVHETLARSVKGLYRGYPESLRMLDAGAFEHLAERLDANWGDPVCHDVASYLLTHPGYLLHAGTIMLLNPATRLVLCERDPVDSALAIYLKWFEKKQPLAWDIDAIAHWITVSRRIAAHWAEVFPDRVSLVRYEQMVADPDATVTSVLAAHGLAWDPACGNEHGLDAGPGIVGLAGSSSVRSRVNSGFGRIGEYYAAQRPRFEHALERAARVCYESTG